MSHEGALDTRRVVADVEGEGAALGAVNVRDKGCGTGKPD